MSKEQKKSRRSPKKYYSILEWLNSRGGRDISDLLRDEESKKFYILMSNGSDREYQRVYVPELLIKNI
jgi:hypothetical protein